MYASNLKEKVGQNVSSSFSLCAIEQKPIVTKQSTRYIECSCANTNERT